MLIRWVGTVLRGYDADRDRWVALGHVGRDASPAGGTTWAAVKYRPGALARVIPAPDEAAARKALADLFTAP